MNQIDIHSTEYWLTTEQVQAQRLVYGSNILPHQSHVHLLSIVIDQFKDVIVWILLGASWLSFLLGEIIDAWIILAIIIINALLWIYQEYKAEQWMEVLLTSSTIQVKVLRDGIKQLIDSTELVPWDLLFLEAGDAVWADLLLKQSNMLWVNESILTWESLPSLKNATTLSNQNTPLAERHDRCFSWTTIIQWSWIGIVQYTWINTQLGAMVALMQSQKEWKTPLQEKLTQFSKQIWLIVALLSLIILWLWLYKWLSLHDLFFIIISLAVSSIPEWLVAVVTITLAFAMQNMYRRHALIRKLKSIESIWMTTVICTDKTWTLTQNHMTVTDLWISWHAFTLQVWQPLPEDIHWVYGFQLLCEAITHCNDAALPHVWDPTEIALLELTESFNITLKPRTWEIPFDSNTKYMITKHGSIEYLKGSPEQILALCSHMILDGIIIKISDPLRTSILNQNDHYARNAIRVLWVWRRDTTQHTDFIFIWLVWMIDPPRAEVSNAIRSCYDAGIRIIMITGDQLLTAQAIASSIGIKGKAIEWKTLEQSLNIAELLEEYTIIARATPVQKVLICDRLKEHWEHVLMTWDGVNDAPALKAADIGCAMWITGTQVTKDASDIVLLDDNFATIVSAIEHGRTVYNNIKKFIVYMLSVNFDELFKIVFCFMIGLPVPLTAIQILWINLVTDSIPTLALGFDSSNGMVMKKPPRSPREWLLDGSWFYIFISTIISASIGIGLFIYKLNTEWLAIARTISTFFAIVYEMFLLFSIRDHQIFAWKLKPNRYLFWSAFIALWMQFIVIYLPWWWFFGFAPLSFIDIVLCIWLWLAWFLFFEMRKRWIKG